MAEALGVDGGEVLDLEDDFAGNILPLGEEVGELSADHLGDDCGRCEFFGLPGSDVLAVSHDCDLVADFEDLVHLVRDINYCNAVLTQVVDDVEQ